MPDITAAEFLALKAEVLELYKTALGGQTLEYHRVKSVAEGGTPRIDRWGHLIAAPTSDPAVPATEKTDLLYSHVYFTSSERFRRKELEPSGAAFQRDYECKVFIPTLDLEQKGVTLERDGAFIRLSDGAEYRLESIEPLPRMHGTSLVHRVNCTRRKPIDDQPGVNG
jgi:hypothetical protein